MKRKKTNERVSIDWKEEKKKRANKHGPFSIVPLLHALTRTEKGK